MGRALSLALFVSLSVACGEVEYSNGSSDSGGCGTAGPAAAPDGATGAAIGPTDAGPPLSLYERLGKRRGLEFIAKALLDTKVLAESDLKTFFFNQKAIPVPAGHPSLVQIEVCLGRFVGAAIHEDSYPGEPVNDPNNTQTPNHTCRSMSEAHREAFAKLNIGGANFDKFVGAFASILGPLVTLTATKPEEITQAELDALVAALSGQKDDVITDGAPSSGPYVPPPSDADVDAGVDVD